MKVLNAGKKAMGEHGANYTIGTVEEVINAVRLGLRVQLGIVFCKQYIHIT